MLVLICVSVVFNIHKKYELSYFYSNETYSIIGKCMDVHRCLGHGFLEIVYKDALELIFKQDGISFARERAMTCTLEEFSCNINFSLTLLSSLGIDLIVRCLYFIQRCYKGSVACAAIGF